MLNDYFALVDPDTGAADEFVNVARTTAYMARGVRPSTFVNVTPCGCDTVIGLPTATTVTERVVVGNDVSTLPEAPPGIVPVGVGSDLDTAGGATIVYDQTPLAPGEQVVVGFTLPTSPPQPGMVLRAVRIVGAGANLGVSTGDVSYAALLSSVATSAPVDGFAQVSGPGVDGWGTGLEVAPLPWAIAAVNGLPSGVVDITLIPDEPLGAATLGANEVWVVLSMGAYAGVPGDPPDSAYFDRLELLWESYLDPQLDNAPWYDPEVPESSAFAGVLPLSVEGLDSNPVTREVTRLQGGGAMLGPLTPTEREVTFQVELIGASCCGVAHGLKWLTAVLNRRCGGEGCDRSDLLFLDCCPGQASVAALDCFGVPAGVYNGSPIRKVTGLGLLSGPAVVERRGKGCGSCGCNPTIVVEFTLVAGNPRVFGETFRALPETSLLPDEPGDDCLDLHWRCEPVPDCESELVLYDAACGSLPPPPAPMVTSSCMCDPLAVHRRMVALPDTVQEWASFVTSFTVTTGSLPLRNLAFRLFLRSGEACGHTLDPAWDDPDVGELFDPLGYPPCDVLSSLGITYVPPNSTLTVDGVRRRAYIDDVNGNRYTASRFIYAASGSPYQWIEPACNGTYCLSIEADAFNTHDGATVAIDVTYRDA